MPEMFNSPTTVQKKRPELSSDLFQRNYENLELVFHYPNTFHLPLGCL